MRGHEHDAPGTHTPNPSSACPVHFPFQRWGAPLGASQCFKRPASGGCGGGTTPDVPRPTGFTTADAQDDFLRARRHAALGRLTARLRREPDDVSVTLPLDEVLEALGRRGERRLGLQSTSLDSIVGSVDRSREFDRRFRPRSSRVRGRWERIAQAQRRGEPLPPISVYRVGNLHFVEDGHHRVSVARALGQTHIDAYVTEVLTELPGDNLKLSDLPLKSHERLFFERVPLPPADRGRIRLSDPWGYAALAEGVEAWGFRAIQARREPMGREDVARAWFAEEYVPVVDALREADLIGRGTETEAYMRAMALRWHLLRTHEWNEEILARLRDELR